MSASTRNTASIPLLRHVSSLNQLTARRLVERRKEKGPFTRREEIQEVEEPGPGHLHPGCRGGLPQAAGVKTHWTGPGCTPRSYETASKVLEKFGHGPDVVLNKEQLPELNTKLAEAELATVSKELEVGELTLRDIVEFTKPDRDPAICSSRSSRRGS